MTLATLRKVMTPPTMPFENGSGDDWSKFEESVGVTLPSDYKEYTTTFGSGRIGKFLSPFNPFTPNKYLNFLDQMKDQLDILREIKKMLGNEECPYPLYPEQGGLLPWGITANGDTLFWLTGNPPSDWLIVIHESRGPTFEQYDESMTDFLAKIISGDIVSNIFPRNCIDKKGLFLPYSS